MSVNSGSTDAAFVAITDTLFEPSNTVYYSDGDGSVSGTLLTLLPNTTATAEDFVEGTWVFSVGANTYLQAGKIRSTCVTQSFDGIVLTDLVTTSIEIVEGDSGSCLFLVKDDDYAAAGIAAGYSNGFGGTFFQSYYSKISYHLTNLGIVKY